MDDELRRIGDIHAHMAELLARHREAEGRWRWPTTLGLWALVLLGLYFVSMQARFERDQSRYMQELGEQSRCLQSQLSVLRDMASKQAEAGTANSIAQGLAEGVAEGAVRSVWDAGISRPSSLFREALIAVAKGFSGEGGKALWKALIDTALPKDGGTQGADRKDETKRRASPPDKPKLKPRGGIAGGKTPRGGSAVTPSPRNGARGVQGSGSGVCRKQEPEVIRAQRFELVDTSGRVRAALRFEVVGWPKPGTEGNSKEEIEPEETPQLVMLDENGTKRAELSVDRHGSWFGLLRETGKHGAILSASYRNNGLGVFDMSGKLRVAVEAGERFPRMGVYRHGLVLLDDDGEQVAGLVANADSEPRLTLVTPEGRELSAP